MISKELEIIYERNIKFAQNHYENFPVISVFLPGHLRKHVAVVYGFARQADDIADEGIFTPGERKQKLNSFREKLYNCLMGNYSDDFWRALHNTIEEFNLTPKYFFDLLEAFEQDITKNRYSSFEELVNYCEKSANPVGRIILEFFNIRDEKAVEFSDAVCTGLQLANFYQDVSVDWEKGRIYLPVLEMEKFNVNEEHFAKKKCDVNFKDLLKYQIERTYLLFEKGKKLLPMLPARLRFQVRLTILGGEEILKKIKLSDFDVLNYRPTLSKTDYAKLFIKSFLGYDR